MYGRRWFFRPVGIDGHDRGNEPELRAEEEKSESSARPQEKINFHKIIWEEFLPNALAIGVPWDVFWHLSPKKLKSFEKAYVLRRKLEDEKMWMMGQYIMSALDATVCNNFLWKGKHGKASEYVKKPILSDIEEKTKENKYKESSEEVAVFEMKQRIKLLEKQGLPQSPS